MKSKLKTIALVFFTILSLSVTAANESKTIKQVTDAVSITQDVDYIITSEEPFTSLASVNMENTAHAVVIIQEIKPTRVIKNWLDHIYIKGEKAQDGVNCQVKMYGRGTIILPYSKDFRPLT